MQLHNNFKVTLTDNNGKTREYTAYNLVTNYGKGILAKSGQYPTRITIGSGEGTPSVDNCAIFGNLATYEAAAKYDFELPNIFKTTLTYTIDENTLKNTTITNIGIGYSTSLYTHALFTDALGEPISIFKGEYERLTLTAYAYVTFNNTYDIPALNALATRVAYGTSFTYPVYSSICLLPKLKSGEYLPIPLNAYGWQQATSSNDTATCAHTLVSSVGNGKLYNSHVTVVRPSLKNYYYDMGVILNSTMFELNDSAKQVLATSDGVTSEYEIPVGMLDTSSLKIYIDDVQLDSGKYSTAISSYLTAYGSNTESLAIMPYTTDYKKYIICPCICGSADSKQSNDLRIPYRMVSIVTLDDDFNVESIETKEMKSDFIVPGLNDSSYSTNHVIFSYPPFYVSQSGVFSSSAYTNQINVYYDNGELDTPILVTSFKVTSNKASDIRYKFMVDANDNNTIYYRDTYYKVDPNTRQVSTGTNPSIPRYLWGAGDTIDLYSYSNYGCLKFTESTKTSTAVNGFDIKTNTTINYTVEHAEITNTGYRIVDTVNKIIVTTESGWNYSYVYVYFMSDDMSTIDSTQEYQIASYGEARNILQFVRIDDLSYMIVSKSDSSSSTTTVYRQRVDIDKEEMTAKVTREPSSNYSNYNYTDSPYFYSFTRNEIEEYKFTTAYGSSTGSTYARHPYKHKVILNEVPSEGSVISYTYGTDCIDKTSDWILSGTYNYGRVLE